jgi:hypothetical protein
MDPKEEWEKFLRGELPPGQLPISPRYNLMLQQIIQREFMKDSHDRRATSSFTRAMSDKMLADCLGKK